MDGMTDEDLLIEAKLRFESASEAESDNRKNFIDDLGFYAGESQWPAEVKREREFQQRPCLMVNRMPQFVRQVTNDQRQNRPAVKVRAVDDSADIQTADILSGLVRHIEANSAADIAYDTAFFYAVTGGFGFYRIITDYCNDKSFEQEIYIKQIANPLTVYADPDAREPDGSDWNYCFVTEEISRKQFDKLYPGKSAGWDQGVGDTKGWMTDDKVRIAEYFYIEKKSVKLVLLSDGSVLPESDFKKLPPDASLTVTDERDAEIKSVKWCKIGGDSVLDKKDWAGKYIPIVPVYGDAIEIDGKRHLLSLIRFAKDPQRMLNYYRSTETELLALQPKAPFVIAEGQVEGYEDLWNSANTVNYSYLPYKPTTVAGVAVPAPQRQGFASVPAGVMQGSLNAESDLKSTTGIYDSALGAHSNETSGVAIRARDHQSDVSTFNFIDNMTRSIRQCGRVVIDLIPKIYDTPRVIRILGEDGSEEMQKVNQLTDTTDKNGSPIQRAFDLSVGQYDVSVSAGPSYTTKREAAAEGMLQLVQTDPQIMGIAGDLIVKNLDWPGAEQIADRIKKALPPNLQDKEDQPQLPPQVQQHIEQQAAQIKQLGDALVNAHKEVEEKNEESRLEWFKAETDRLKVVGAGMTPEQVAIIVKDTLHEIITNPGGPEDQKPFQQMPQEQPQAPPPDPSQQMQPPNPPSAGFLTPTDSQ
jgi:hypothetical protein